MTKIGGELLPLFVKLGLVGLDVGCETALAELVGLREDQSEGDALLAQPLDELQVDLLRIVSAVQEHEEQYQLLAL